MTRWKRHALKLVLVFLMFLIGVAGLFRYSASRIRIPSAADATDARESLESLRSACSKLADKTCYWKPTVDGPILFIYGVTEETERQEVEGAARRVLPRTEGTRVVLKFYRSEVIHEFSNGVARRETEELLDEVVID